MPKEIFGVFETMAFGFLLLSPFQVLDFPFILNFVRSGASLQPKEKRIRAFLCWHFVAKWQLAMHAHTQTHTHAITYTHPSNKMSLSQATQKKKKCKPDGAHPTFPSHLPVKRFHFFINRSSSRYACEYVWVDVHMSLCFASPSPAKHFLALGVLWFDLAASPSPLAALTMAHVRRKQHAGPALRKVIVHVDAA